MTNEEAIKAIEEYLDTADGEGHVFPIKFLTALDVVISALKNEWIPIEERLPKCCGVYYVTRLLGDGFEEQYITDASFFDGSNKWHDDNRINHDRDYLDDVVAWFETEPYKKGE